MRSGKILDINFFLPYTYVHKKERKHMARYGGEESLLYICENLGEHSQRQTHLGESRVLMALDHVRRGEA